MRPPYTPVNVQRVIWLVWIVAAAIAAYVGMGFYLAAVLKWGDERTVGLNYYGRSRGERDAFKRSLARHALLLSPLLWLNARMVKADFRRVRIQYRGTSAPAGSCSIESFERATSWRASPEDVFVVTQMKCGTTWMQQVVHEILHRGRGTMVETGATMYATSPWLEGRKSVPVENAPLVGAERPSRIIKTHLPVTLCPWSESARYVYVARHPVSCFASCIDFVQTNLGGMAPGMSAFEEWFCSRDLMWWGTWADHVRGWWDRSRRDTNVLFLFFEDMKKDLPAVVRRVAAFLGVAPLTDEELRNVVHKSSFSYMQENQDCFEMMPPHILQSRARLFVSGSAERHKDVPDDVRRRVAGWAARELAGTGFPLAERYPDVT